MVLLFRWRAETLTYVWQAFLLILGSCFQNQFHRLLKAQLLQISVAAVKWTLPHQDDQVKNLENLPYNYYPLTKHLEHHCLGQERGTEISLPEQRSVAFITRPSFCNLHPHSLFIFYSKWIKGHTGSVIHYNFVIHSSNAVHKPQVSVEL